MPPAAARRLVLLVLFVAAAGPDVRGLAGPALRLRRDRARVGPRATTRARWSRSTSAILARSCVLAAGHHRGLPAARLSRGLLARRAGAPRAGAARSWCWSSCPSGRASWCACTRGSSCCAARASLNQLLAGLGLPAADAALQRRGGAAGPGLRRAAVHDPAPVRVAGAAGPLAARGRGGPGRAPAGAPCWRVTLPLTRPGIVAGCVLVFIPSLGAYLAPDLLGGARTVYVGNLVQSQFAVARDIPFGSAAVLRAHRSWCWRCWSSSAGRCGRHEGIGVSAAPVRRPGPRSRSRSTSSSTRRLLVLVAFSFNRGGSPPPGRASRWSGTRARCAARRSCSSLRNSLLVAFADHRRLRRCIGTAAALALHRHRFRRRRRHGTRSLTLPMVVPEVVLAVLAAAALRQRRPAPGPAHGDPGPRRLLALLRGRRGARAPGGLRPLAGGGGDGPGRGALARLLARDPARHRSRRAGRGAAGLRALPRRLRGHLVRGRRGLHHPARPRLLDGEERRLAGDQRGLHPAPGRHQPAALRGLAAGAGRAARGALLPGGGRAWACWLAPFVQPGAGRGPGEAC